MHKLSKLAHIVSAFTLAAAASTAGLPALAAAPSAATVTISHAKGSTTLAAAPKRVVVYDLGALEILQALGVPVAGGPKAQWPHYMADYTRQFHVAGSLFEPDYDALSALHPQLIIVGGRSSAKQESLSKIAPTLDFSMGGDAGFLPSLERNITQLAMLYGKQAQGEALIARIHQELQALRQLSNQAAPGLLLMGINEKIMPQAPGTRFGQVLFDVMGVKSALNAQDIPARGGPAYTFDDLAKLNPDWIYVIDRNTAVGSAAGVGDIITSEKVFDNAQVKASAAGQKGQVVFLDPKGWYLMGSSGPLSLLANIEQLKTAYRAAGLRP